MIEIALCVVLLLLVIRPFMNITRHIAQQSYAAKTIFANNQQTPVTRKALAHFVCIATKKLPQKALERISIYA